MSQLPLVSYPSMVTLIDDDIFLLQAISGLFEKSYRLKIFNSPIEGLAFFKKYQPVLTSLKTLRGCTDLENYDVCGNLPVDLDFVALKKLRQQTERLNDIGVVIIDYNMPGMNGIELCRHLKSLPFKKILLTGEADDQLAITAFNERIIDCFIRKDSPSLACDLACQVNILTQEYFADSTKRMLSHVETHYPIPASDPIFVTFFKEWCRTHRIQEFYLIDPRGNFLMLDENKNETYFIVHTDRTLNDFIELHDDNRDFGEYLSSVMSREKIPFFGEGKESWWFEPSEWESYFHVPQVLSGREKYYWAVI